MWILNVVTMFPMIVTAILLILGKQFGFSNKKSLQWSADGSTPFFIVSIFSLLELAFVDRGVLIGIVLLTVIAVVVAIIERKESEYEFSIRQTMKKIWRTYFLSTVSLYVVFVIIALVTYTLKGIIGF